MCLHISIDSIYTLGSVGRVKNLCHKYTRFPVTTIGILIKNALSKNKNDGICIYMYGVITQIPILENVVMIMPKLYSSI